MVDLKRYQEVELEYDNFSIKEAIPCFSKVTV
jgi:hypothetical protein